MSYKFAMLAESEATKRFRGILFRNVLLPLGLAVLLSGIFIGMIRHLVRVNKSLDQSNAIIANAHEALQLVVDAETGMRGYMITRKDHFLEPYERATRATAEHFTNLRKLVDESPLQLDRVIKSEARFKEWLAFSQRTIGLTRDYGAMNKTLVELVSSEEGKRLIDAIRRDITSLVSDEEKLRDSRNRQSEQSTSFSLLVIVFGSLAVGIFLALYARKQLLTVSESYQAALDKQMLQNQTLKDQAWLQKGQTSLNGYIRGDFSIRKISEETMKFLANYLEAKVGAFYVADTSSHDLALEAGYALPKDRMPGREVFRVGQSLVGQAALENRSLTLDNVPVDYALPVNSALGDGQPRSLAIAPLSADGLVQAVVELGFMSPPTALQIEFLNRISESVGVAIRSAHYKAQLQALLEESQRQSEELQTQQEELRVNNEELEEQAKALKMSQTKLETQQAELEQINSELGQQSSHLERKNEELNVSRVTLEQKARELELASQYKSQFLANMSHELRTPLNSTLILSQLLAEDKEGRLSAEQIEFANTIVASSNDLLSLINDILDLSKVEAGKIDLHPEEITLPTLAQSIDKTFRVVAEKKKIDFSVDVQSNPDSTFESDRLRVDQILKNLVSNAVKFTEAGAVSLTITETPDWIQFAVKDSGIGISPDQQQVIFEAFQQADGTTSRKYGGTGLGLAISRDLTKLLGGRLEVASQVGRGSIFTLSLPKCLPEGPLSAEWTAKQIKDSLKQKQMARPPTPPAASPATPFQDDRKKLDSKRKVLMVIEDDPSFAKILYDLSHEMNFNCIVCHGADEGIRAVQEFLPSAVILDLNLPDHSGLVVLDRLKENSLTRHIPVHVISGLDSSRLALQMGAVGYLQKPAAKDGVLAVMRKLEEKLSQNIKKVLLVEDNAAQRQSVSKLISDASVQVEPVETGAQALKALAEQDFDCLILDLTLPDMSGYELLEKLNALNKSSPPPVVVYTGRSLSRSEEDLLRKYSRSIILKGVRSPERLLSEVSLFLHQVEAKMPVERQKSLRELRNRERSFEGKTILVVDDDVRNIFALSSALEQRGANVLIGRNGFEAIEKMNSDPSIELVLMDVMMPGMDGFEAMRALRKEARFARVPIIAVTAKAMADDQEKCLEAGASDYLAKPIDLQKLLSLMKVWLAPSGGKFD